MTNCTSMLFGTTNKTGSVPSTCKSGPTYSPDQRLILSESFCDFHPLKDHLWFEAGLRTLLDGPDYVESWRIWDCYAQDWAPIDLILHRFDYYDLVIRKAGNKICSWRGALNTQDRVLASTNPEENIQNCWQWLRYKQD